MRLNNLISLLSGYSYPRFHTCAIPPRVEPALPAGRASSLRSVLQNVEKWWSRVECSCALQSLGSPLPDGEVDQEHSFSEIGDNELRY